MTTITNAPIAQALGVVVAAKLHGAAVADESAAQILGLTVPQLRDRLTGLKPINTDELYWLSQMLDEKPSQLVAAACYPFVVLDQAMAGVRLLSAAITQAVEDGDTDGIPRLNELREALSDDVTSLLHITAAMLPDDVR